MLRPLVLACLVLAPLAASAQTPNAGPRATAEVVGGYTGFPDESMVDHAVAGGSVRYQLSPRVSVGPELVYMVGPGNDRDLLLMGTMWIHFTQRPAGERGGSVNPFIVIGGGLMRHGNRYGASEFSHVGGAFSGGAGARVWISERVYGLGEYRMGSGFHIRMTGGLGVAW
jgi:hypothetical protein